MNQLVIMLRKYFGILNKENIFFFCNLFIRTYGIEPSLVDEILSILSNNLTRSENDPLDIHTIRTIAQFMIEKKNLIISLLVFALKYQPVNKNFLL